MAFFLPPPNYDFMKQCIKFHWEASRTGAVTNTIRSKFILFHRIVKYTTKWAMMDKKYSSNFDAYFVRNSPWSDNGASSCCTSSYKIMREKALTLENMFSEKVLQEKYT